MKIIFSRKGYDLASGGIASPIFPNGTFCSLPIPSTVPPMLKDIRFGEERLSRIVGQLRKNENVGNEGAHLDPDLNRDACYRKRNWLPCFGQIGAAQSHLDRQNVCEGDLFLFFGWFREVVMVNSKLHYRTGARDIHALFGWLQIGTIYHPGRSDDEPPHWAFEHPHVRDEERRKSTNNTLYVASEQLRLPGIKRPVAGGGIFSQFCPRLQLTEPGQRKRSVWRLPTCFYPVRGAPPLSYHSDMSRWSKDKKGALLQTVGRGQEFVLDCEYYPKALNWIHELFKEAPTIHSSRRAVARD